MADAASAFARAGRALSKFKPSKRMPDDKRVVCVKCILHALGLCEPCQGEVGVKIPRKYLRHLSVDEAKSLYPTLESLFEDEGKADAARAERAAKVAAAIEAAAKAKASGGTASAAAPGTSASSSKPTAEAERSVAVAGLPFKTTADEIRAHFDACGTIVSIRNKFGYEAESKFKGLAFLLFSDVAGCTAALNLDGSELGGRWIKVKVGLPRGKKRALGSSRLMVGNLPTIRSRPMTRSWLCSLRTAMCSASSEPPTEIETTESFADSCS